MEKLLLIVVAASGLFASSSHADRQYRVIYEKKNMTEAQSYCREKYTDLVSIDNMDDMNTLINMVDLSKMVNSTYGDRAWIGLYRPGNKWRWSLSNQSFYQQDEAEFRNWDSNEPNNGNREQFCTEIYNSGPWNDGHCYALRKPICMDVRGSNVTFVLINTNMNWIDAQSYCREHHTDLASVRNMEENQRVKVLVPPAEGVWIGLFSKSWGWLDGSDSSFTYWANNEPNDDWLDEACVVASFINSGKWEDLSCESKKAFICYSVPVSKKVLRLKLKINDSSVDLNDQTVKDEILKQIKQRLKDNGVNKDVKLSWKEQDGKVFHKDQETKQEKKKKKNKRKKTSSSREDL